MSWLRMDDGFADHPKWVEVEDDPALKRDCIAVWVVLACQASKLGRGGLVPVSRARHVMRHVICDVTRQDEVLSTLLRLGFLDPSDDGVQFHDWADYNTDAEWEAARRRKNAERNKKWREAKRAEVVGNALPDASRDDLRDASRDASATRSPSPIPFPLLDVPSEHRRAAPDPGASEVREVFEHWVRATGKDPARTKLTPDRRRRIQARLRDGYSVADCKRAIDGVASSPFHSGENDQGRRYDSIELVFRNGDKLEQFRELGSGVAKAAEPEHVIRSREMRAQVEAAEKRRDFDEAARIERERLRMLEGVRRQGAA